MAKALSLQNKHFWHWVYKTSTFLICRRTWPRHWLTLSRSSVSGILGASADVCPVALRVAFHASGGLDMYNPPHMTCILLLIWHVSSSSYDMYPPFHMTCMALRVAFYASGGLGTRMWCARDRGSIRLLHRCMFFLLVWCSFSLLVRCMSFLRFFTRTPYNVFGYPHTFLFLFFWHPQNTFARNCSRTLPSSLTLSHVHTHTHTHT